MIRSLLLVLATLAPFSAHAFSLVGGDEISVFQMQSGYGILIRNALGTDEMGNDVRPGNLVFAPATNDLASTQQAADYLVMNQKRLMGTGDLPPYVLSLTVDEATYQNEASSLSKLRKDKTDEKTLVRLAGAAINYSVIVDEHNGAQVITNGTMRIGLAGPDRRKGH